MKHSFYRILAILCALCMVLPALYGCSGTKPAADGEQSTAPTEPETEAPGAGLLTLITASKASVHVVRADMNASETAIKCTVAIRQKLLDYCPEVPIDNDWTRDGKHDPEPVEILVGVTNYEETAVVAAELSATDWCVRAVGHKILVYSQYDRALEKATASFIASLEAAAVSKDGGKTYDLAVDPEAIRAGGSVVRVASSVPQPDGATLNCFYDPGDDCDEVIYNGGTADGFAAYVDKMKKAGFTVRDHHDVNGSSFATLYNDEYTVSAGFYADSKQYRLVVQPFTPQSIYGAEEDNKYEAVTTSRITMLGCQYTMSDGKQNNTGASFLIRLADGRFVILDGGHNRSEEMDNLVRRMKEQSADYVSKTGGIRIAAWIITHPHGDHYYVLTKFFSKLKGNGITCERIMFNFLSEEEMNKCYDKYKDDLKYDMPLIYNAAKALKADVVIPHVGQRYYIANMVMETLFTIESYAPNLINDLNGLSLIAKMTFTDPATGKQNTFMTVGDATGYDFRCIAKTFGSALKSDICQIAHHGASTKGDDAGTILAYKQILPATVLWSSGQGAYTAYEGNAYNNVVINPKTNPEFKEVFVAGLSGRATVLDLPYSPGEARVSN